MKITKLTAENFKRLVAVEITPDGNMVIISGKNGAGKTSVLDSIMATLCGKKFCPEKPVREGEKRAKVKVEMGDYTATRTFTADGGGTIKLEGKGGSEIKRPQEFLDDLVGKISFDPLAFVNEPDPKKQRKILLELVGVDLDKNKEVVEVLRGQRQTINREKARLKGVIASIPDIADTTTEEVSFVELTNQLQKANTDNNVIESVSIEIGTAQKQLEQFRERMDVVAKDIADRIKWLQEHPAIDTKALTEQIANAEKNNVLVQQAKQRKELTKQLEIEEHNYKVIGDELDDIEKNKAKMLQEIKMPVEGLGVDDDGVIYNGIPIAQIADSEKLKVGVAVSMALNPTLKVMSVKDGSLLDSANLAILADMVKDKDYQLWLERVDETGSVGIIIEDGMVKK